MRFIVIHCIHRLTTAVALTGMCLLLNACGGGGGGNPNSPPTPPTPTSVSEPVTWDQSTWDNSTWG